MTIITISAVGVAAVLMALQLKGLKGEYASYLAAAAGFFIFFYGVSKLESILETVRQLQSYIKLNPIYLTTLMKMVGITYVAEFSSAICKDAGYQTIAVQIEIFAKLAILVLSMPVLMALLSAIRDFLA